MQRRVRFQRPPGNQLRRRCDRIEKAIVVGLVAFFTLAGPAAAVAAGSLADHSLLRQVRAQRSWHQVTATLAHPQARALQASASNWVMQPVLVTWTAAGRTHSGRIALVAPPGKAGKVPVWVDAAGQLTDPPSASANLHLAVGLAGFAGALAVAVILFLASVASRFLLNRRRMADWDRAWQVIGPEWSRQL
jgi:hypothetical protein